MVRLEKVSEKTFKKVIDMKLPEEQNKFVAPNVVSLAQAWLYADETRPFAVCDDDTVVGFLMMDWDESERTVGIWRFMIAPEHQRKGYGRQAMQEAIKMAREADIDMMNLDYVPSNTVARDLYYSLGFRENGDVDNGEIIMTMPLTDNPKVGKLVADFEDEEDIIEIYHSEYDMLIQGQVGEEKRYTDSEIHEAIDREQVIRFTLMGETIGFSIVDDLFASKEYTKYYEEIKKRFTEGK